MESLRVLTGAHVADESRGDPLLYRLRLFFTTERLSSPHFLVLFWFLTRLAVFLVWGVFTPSAQGDVLYYYDKIDRMFLVGPEMTMQEYPTPVLWLLTVPWLLGLGTPTGYVIAFVFLMLVLDVGFSWTLWKTGGRMRGQALVFWSGFLLLAGPTAYLRFDIVTSVLAGWALISVMRHRPDVAGAISAIGASVKLWPALLWPALLGGDRRQQIRATSTFFGTGILLVIVSLIWAGWDRLLSPLSWQSGRGLQVESIWATIPMLMRSLGIGDFVVAVSRFQAFEIWGPGVAFFSTVADVAFFSGLIAMVCAYALWIRRGSGRLIEAFALMMFVVLLMIVTNKTFSPQYMIWLGGPMSAAFTILGQEENNSFIYSTDRRHIKWSSILIAWILLLTTLVYPIGYGNLVRDYPGAVGYLQLPVTLALATRNLLMLGLFIGFCQWIWSFVKPFGARSS